MGDHSLGLRTVRICHDRARSILSGTQCIEVSVTGASRTCISIPILERIISIIIHIHFTFYTTIICQLPTFTSLPIIPLLH